MNLTALLLWGFAATTILTTMLRGSQALGLTRIDLPLVLGLVLHGRPRPRQGLWLLLSPAQRLAVRLCLLRVLPYFGYDSWWLGALMGAVHGLFVLIVVLPVLPGVHPRMATDAAGPEPTRELEPPGFLALNYGRRHAHWSRCIAHIVYGAILGLFLPMP